MTDTNLQNKARAVVLSALMVLSVMVGTIALSGGAAATANQVTLSDDLVSGNEEVYINGSVGENGTVHAFVDSNGDGYYNKSSEKNIGSETIEDYNSDSKYSISYTANSESGLYNISVVQKPEDDDSTSDVTESALLDGDSEDVSTTLKVDADGPVFGDESPEDGSTINQANADEITVPIWDDNTSVTQVNATIEGPNGEINTWEINPNSADGDGVAWNEEGLVIEPGTGDVPALVDGSYTVTVDAVDEVGNENTTTFDFTVESQGLDFVDVNSIDGTETPDENQTVAVEVSDTSNYGLNNSTVELTISGDGYSETFNYEDDVYTNSSDGIPGVFSIDPSASEDVPAFDDGSYTVTVSGEDEIGNYDETTYTFTVDTQGPTVESVELTDSALNNSDITENDEQVVVTFKDDDVNSVSATVSVGGTTEPLSFTESDGKFVADLSLGSTLFSSVENDSAIVNVTAATDNVGNDLTNADSDASNATFAIDTIAPTVKTDGNLPGTVSGYVNFTAHHSVTDDDGNGLTYWLKVDSQDSTYGLLPSPSHFDTTRAWEGNYVLKVQATDDAGNVHSLTKDIVIDNAEPSLSYDADATLTGKVNITTFLHVENAGVGTSDINYWYAYSADGTFDGSDWVDADEFNVNDKQEGFYKLRAVVQDPGYDTNTEQTLTTKALKAEKFDSGDFDINAERYPTGNKEKKLDPGHLNITLESDYDLSGLNVTIESVDGYYSQNSETLSLDKFKETKGAHHEYNYTLTTHETPRDGEYEISLDNATTTGGLTLDSGVTAKVIEADGHQPDLADADIVGTEKGHTQVNLTFDQPVWGLTADEIQYRDGVTVLGLQKTSSGSYVATFDTEIQTGDGVNLTIAENSYSEVQVHKTDSQNDKDTMPVDSVELDLQKGANLVSIPVESGSVDLDDVDFCGCVDVVWAYDNGKWTSYDPSTDKGNDLKVLKGGQGYVFIADKATSIDVRGYTVPAPDDDSGATPSVPTMEGLEKGWNLVGHFQEGKQSTTRAFSLIQDLAPEVGILGQANDYSYNDVDTLVPGEAYWVYVDGTDTYTAMSYEGEGDSIAPSFTSADAGDADDDSSETNDKVEASEQVTVTATVSGATNVYVAPSDLNASTQELSSTGGDSYTATFDVADDVSGEKTLTLVAMDADGITTEKDVTVSVDTTSASISSVSLANDGSDNLAFSFDSNEQLSTISVSVDGPTTTDAYTFDETQFSETESSGTYTYTLTATKAYGDGDGSYTATVDDAIDAAGNNGGATGLTDSYTLDTTKPTGSYSGSSTVSTASPTSLTFDLSDATSSINPSSISVTVSDQADATIELDAAGTGDSHVSYDSNTLTVDLSASTAITLNDGTTDLSVTFEDSAGNSKTVTGTVTVDTTGTTVNNFAPSDGSTVNSISNDQITFDVSDATSSVDMSTLSVSVSDSDSTIELDAAGTGHSAVSVSSGTVTIDTTAMGDTLADGSVTVSANVDDTAGNNGQGSATFTLDTTKLDFSSSSVTLDNTNQGGSDTVSITLNDEAQNVIETTPEDDFTVAVTDNDASSSDATAAAYTINDAGDSNSATYQIVFSSYDATAGDDITIGLSANNDVTDEAGNGFTSGAQTQATA